jgi:lipopolysaccharide transport system permease protein
VVGYFWSLIEPLLLSAVYVVLFLIISHDPVEQRPLLVIIGVIAWGFFSTSVNRSLTSLTRNEAMLKQVFFPREIFAITTVGAQLMMSSLSLLVVIPFMIYFRLPPTGYLLMVPAGLVLLTMLALGIGLGTACLSVINRDVEYFFKFLMRAGMFVSPVMWTADMIPPARQGMLEYLVLNPVFVPIEMIRGGIVGHPVHVSTSVVIYSVTFCVLSLLIGAMVFKRYEAMVVKKL